MLPAMMAGIYAAAASFSPVTHTYTSGSGSETVPSGATGVTITVIGGGGGSGWAIGSNGAGGGAGGTCIHIASVDSSEWGTTLGYAAGAAGSNETFQTGNDSTDGQPSVVTGTIGLASISLSGNGGGSTNTNTAGGTGGTASGGNSANNTGNAGSTGAPGVGGVTVPSSAYGYGGDGHNTYPPAGGLVKFEWT